FLFDIDESGALEPALRRIHRPDRTGAPIVYRIADFVEAQCPRTELDRIDLLYFSSFTPDEMRRRDVAERHRRHGRADERGVAAPAAPEDPSPLHDVVRKGIDLSPPAGGTFILQSYYAGVDPRRNPNYVRQWKQVLRQHGVTLIESYHFSAAPGITLWIGRK